MLVFVGLIARAAFIQVVEPGLLIKQGDKRTLRTRTNDVHRGIISDRNGEQLAVSVPVRAIWANPKIIYSQGGTTDVQRWSALARVLGQDVDQLMAKVNQPQRTFVYLQRQVTPAMASYVEDLDLPGIYTRKESRRYYPAGEVSAHVIGFTDVDDQGQEGLEKLYNQYLSGTPDSRVIRKDGVGRQVEVLAQTSGKQAQNLSLTLDQRIQAMTYRELKQAVLNLNASSGSAVVVDVGTGEILAMVNSPSFNPNNRKDLLSHKIRNRAITDAYEPGSSVKPLAVLSALEFGTVDLDTTINTSPGWMRVGGKVVRDARDYGELSLTKIIQKSSNLGTSKLALSVPKEFLLDIYYNMGLMTESGTGLIGESSGIFYERRRWSDFELSALSFGYGLSVTTLQLARMYSVIASGGIKRPLSIVRTGYDLEEERVVDQKHANALLAMMEKVVSHEGSGRKARVPGYRVAGKTGTSRKAVSGGYGEEYVNIFSGIAPASDPQLVVVVLINEPSGDLYYAGDTAAPVFSRIMSSSLQMLNVPPDDKALSSLASLEKRYD
jgi:cell division protein FtsI (penicillin-binding protein 3)